MVKSDLERHLPPTTGERGGAENAGVEIVAPECTGGKLAVGY